MPMPLDLVISDRRNSPRRAVSERVKLELNDDTPGSPSGLLVTDVSDGGVRLFVQDVELPDTFALVFVESGIRRVCRIVWRIGPEAGLKFVDQGPGSANGRRKRSRSRSLRLHR